jgi:hypothetical protein
MKKSSSRLHSRKKIETVSHVKKGVFDWFNLSLKTLKV